MKVGNKIFFSIVVYPILPILLFLLAWWISIPLIQQQYIFIPTLTGLIIGILFDIIFIRKQEQNFYKTNKLLLLSIIIFYHIGIFGFFMGVPIFNLIPGLIASIYTSKTNVISEKKLQILNASLLTIICTFSAYLALKDPYTKSNLEGMFNLNFKLTDTHIWLIIIFGWIALLLAQYIISKIVLYDENRKATTIV